MGKCRTEAHEAVALLGPVTTHRLPKGERRDDRRFRP